MARTMMQESISTLSSQTLRNLGLVAREGRQARPRGKAGLPHRLLHLHLSALGQSLVKHRCLTLGEQQEGVA